MITVRVEIIDDQRNIKLKSQRAMDDISTDLSLAMITVSHALHDTAKEVREGYRKQWKIEWDSHRVG